MASDMLSFYSSDPETFVLYSTFAGQKDSGTWRERLQAWREILRKEKLTEDIDSLRAKYVVEFDMKEVEKSLRKDVVEKKTDTQGTRGLWVSKRWWYYRPKLPYTYFLDKLDSSEVQCSFLYAGFSWQSNLTYCC